MSGQGIYLTLGGYSSCFTVRGRQKGVVANNQRGYALTDREAVCYGGIRQSELARLNPGGCFNWSHLNGCGRGHLRETGQADMVDREDVDGSL